VPLRGEKLDKASYANLRSTGGGAVGEAWVGDHEVLGCKVVQKRYSVIGMEDAAACREPRILLQMEHPNVVRVLEAQWDPEMDRAITFVTVYCDGRCVAKALDEDYRFSVGQALRLTVQMLSALAYAHTDPSLRVVHRDVKPGNAFLDRDPQDALPRRLGLSGGDGRIRDCGRNRGDAALPGPRGRAARRPSRGLVGHLRRRDDPV
jgi:eukaryotic-like serine/threonine-protein kinase